MSRPIYEPSLPRADAAQAWGSRQLFRRPAPSSSEEECPCEGAWAYKQSSNYTEVPQDTWTRVELQNDDGTGTSGDPYTMVTDGIEFVLGKYIITGIIYWDGYLETGALSIAGPASEGAYYATPLSPTCPGVFTTSGSWVILPDGGSIGFFTEAYLWAYQSTSPAAHALGHILISELI